MRKAPWPDFAGNQIHEGDTIRHPNGDAGVVVFVYGADSDSDAWRVMYEHGVSRLCLQIGDKGKAVVIHSTKEQRTMNDQEIEQEIQQKGLTAPRITPADIEANISSEHYFTAAEGVIGAYREGSDVHPVGGTPSQDAHASLSLLTFCVLVLRNGFAVTGESACASQANFDAELGRKIARKNAIEQIWPLMGYALKERLSENPIGIVIDNNQGGSNHIVQAPPNTTIPVGTELFARGAA